MGRLFPLVRRKKKDNHKSKFRCYQTFKLLLFLFPAEGLLILVKRVALNPEG